MNSQSTSLPTVPQLSTEPAKELVPAAETTVLPQAPAKKGRIRRVLLAGAAVALLATASWYGSDYWTIGRFLVSTDDAYVKADNTTIAPKVSGYLNQVLVADNERVKSGQVLARIDDRDFKVALDQAKADVAAAQAAVESKRAQLDVQQAVIASARATLDVDTAAQGYSAIWQAVIDDFHARHSLADARIAINDNGATPATVSLRLDQAVEEFAAAAGAGS